MLLLQRKANQSVIIHKNGEPDDAMVVRLVETYPTGDVTLGFMGTGYTVVRNEIFKNGTTSEESMNEEKLNTEMELINERSVTGYYS